MKINSAKFVKGIKGTDTILFDGLPQVAFVGRSNVGKSSIINSLLHNSNLVKVSTRPGKTTEINFFKVNNKIYFVDLPGYGYAKVSPAEKEKLKKLILWYLMGSGVRPLKVVLILDIKAGFTQFDEEMVNVLREYEHSYLIVANKVDKLNQKDLIKQLRQIRTISGEEGIVKCSTLAKGGMQDLQKRLFL